MSCSDPRCAIVEALGTRLAERSTWALAALALALAALALVAPVSGAEEPAPALEEYVEPPLDASAREHWSFRPLEAGDETATIDGFIAARLDAAALEPLGEADRATLLRRLTYDVTGLPPALDEVDAFVADDSPDAWAKVVDRVLASPAAAERWAQRWLDLARFAETDGFEHDNQRPNAWRYRDWVIATFAEDMPYDEFVALQIAGDELRPGDAAAAVATGFLLSGPDMPDINLEEERRHVLLNEMTSTVGAVFLGLQVGCAQCHDHKFDPISQADFYRLRAVFEPALVLAEQPLPGALASSATAATTPRSDDAKGRIVAESGQEPAPSHLRVRGDFRRPGPALEPGFPRVANPHGDAIAAAPAGATSSGRRRQLAAWLTRPDAFLATRVIADRVWQHHFGAPLVATPSDFGRSTAEPPHAELLDWLARRLVADGWSLKALGRRILLSAVWRRASAATPDDDAAQRGFELARSNDPRNDLFWRAPRRRLEGEAIRDALLAVAGRLNFDRRGGPGVMAPLSSEVLATIRRDHWKVSGDETAHRRRSVYLFARRNLRYPLFEVFDRPDANASCAERDRSTTAPQALLLLNSPECVGYAQAFAGRVLAETLPEDGAAPRGATRERIVHAYRLAYGRRPDSGEVEIAARFLDEQTARIEASARPSAELALPLPTPLSADPERLAAWTDLCLALINLNEFLWID